MRALAVDHDDLHAQRLRDDQDVAENDGSVDEADVALDGLQGQGRCDFGRAAAFEEVVAGFGFVVFGEVAACLAHYPHGRTLGFLAWRGAELVSGRYGQ